MFTGIDVNKINSSITDDALFVIGNGFDLAHGVKSTYYDFKKSLGNYCYLKDCLEICIFKDDIWGNFEDSLAHLDRAFVLDGIDTGLEMFDVKDEFDDDFSAADYFLAIENTTMPVETIEKELPKKFRRWVEKLNIKDKHFPLAGLLNCHADYINFNYTEFLETHYGINGGCIKYIHGDRRNKKQPLILGHGYDTDELYSDWQNTFNVKMLPKNSPARLRYFSNTDNVKRWKSQSRYDATQAAAYRIEEYYEKAAKKTKNIIEKNREYFKSLSSKNNVIVIGHSLSFVDYPYFLEIIKCHQNPDKINWYISFHNDNDIERIKNFAAFLNVEKDKVKIFNI